MKPLSPEQRRLMAEAANAAKFIAKTAPKNPFFLAAGAALALHYTTESSRRNLESPEFTIEEANEALVVSSEKTELRIQTSVRFTPEDGDGPTLYHLLKRVLETDPAFCDLSSSDQSQVIDATIAAARVLNPNHELDQFKTLIGHELLLPAAFDWKPLESSVLDTTHGGYSAVQAYAKRDGFPLDQLGSKAQFEEALERSEPVPPRGEGWKLDREGSEDSPARLDRDVIAGIESLGTQFHTLSLNGKPGWSFVITDMLRDPSAQKKRGSIKNSTHSTGRSFDVSDGQWITPEGVLVTWSERDERGRASKGPWADTIDETLRPAFQKEALKAGWVLFKEPGHWHVYVPELHTIDLTEEWERALTEEPEPAETKKPTKKKSSETKTTIERSKLTQKIGDALLKDAKQLRKDRLSEREARKESERVLEELTAFFRTLPEYQKSQPERPYLTVLRYFKRNPDVNTRKPVTTYEQSLQRSWHKERVLNLIQRTPPDALGDLAFLQGTTIHREDTPAFSDLGDVWKWKTTHKLNEKYNNLGKYVAQHVETNNHSMDFETWFQFQSNIQDALLKDQEEDTFNPELVRTLGPELMLSTIHAEYFSELDGPTFIALVPTLFEGYNLAFGPAINDTQFSSGLAQLIEPTFALGSGSLLGRYEALAQRLKDRVPALQDLVIPEVRKTSKSPIVNEIADAMVLQPESAMFWAYISVLYHTEAGFNRAMKSEVFQKAWKNAPEQERLRFVAALSPRANNSGRGGAISLMSRVIKMTKSSDLRVWTEHLTTTPGSNTAVRGARTGLASMDALLELAK